MRGRADRDLLHLSGCPWTGNDRKKPFGVDLTGTDGVGRRSYAAHMRGAGDELSVGERVAHFRRRRGLTQATLAGLMGRTERWIGMIENGGSLNRLDVIKSFAEALRVTMEDLLGQPVLAESDQPAGDNVPAVRDALMNHRRLSSTLFGSQGADSSDLDTIDEYTGHAWLNYQHGRLSGVIEALPRLIRGAQTLDG